jgi:lipopolysaccharide transport system ATP-binding protein
MSTVIKVENLSKQYRLGSVGLGSISHDFNRWWHGVLGKEDPYLKIGEKNDRTLKGESDYVWALRDINFEVKQGEALGIIGRNGAGKSTLLKILSRTTSPTLGNIKIKGRVASLLEVGTGFHPELSGRENIFLNGAILGMTKAEVKSKFDEIVDFAGVERYIDTPVKRYSSGMYVRLAFGVAAHLEPEILIIDEVLAVGDAEFQKKALGKMQEVSSKDGRTVLFVSHHLDAISRLCANTLVIEQGNIAFRGPSHEAISFYLKAEQVARPYKSWPDGLSKEPGNDFVKLLEVRVTDQQGTTLGVHEIPESINITMKYEVLVDGFIYTHGFNLYNVNGVHIFTSHDIEMGKKKLENGKGIYEASVTIPGNFLTDGLHVASVAIMSYDPYTVHFHEMDAVSFNIIDVKYTGFARGVYNGKMPGIIRPILNWKHNKTSQ